MRLVLVLLGAACASAFIASAPHTTRTRGDIQPQRIAALAVAADDRGLKEKSAHIARSAWRVTTLIAVSPVRLLGVVLRAFAVCIFAAAAHLDRLAQAVHPDAWPFRNATVAPRPSLPSDDLSKSERFEQAKQQVLERTAQAMYGAPTVTMRRPLATKPEEAIERARAQQKAPSTKDDWYKVRTPSQARTPAPPATSNDWYRVRTPSRARPPPASPGIYKATGSTAVAKSSTSGPPNAEAAEQEEKVSLPATVGRAKSATKSGARVLPPTVGRAKAATPTKPATASWLWKDATRRLEKTATNATQSP